MAKKNKSATMVKPDRNERIEMIKQRYYELVVKPRQRMAEDFDLDDDHLAEDDYGFEEADVHQMYDLDRI